MKRILIALAFLIGSIASAAATCTSPATMHDFLGSAFLMSLATVPDGNCGSNVAIPTWAGGTLGAMANYGTSPGAVLVPGMNAFITNTPSVIQSGTWTVQPGNTANTTPWLVQGNVSNASSAVATGSTNEPTVSYNYGFNGTTWDQLQVDGSKNLKVNVQSAVGLASGSTTSGQTGSMTMGAVTTANPSYTTAQTNYTSMDVKGNTRVVLGGGVPETASATGTTAATTATLATSATTTTYICGFSIRANATAAATGNATVTGTITGTLNFTQWTAPLASGLGVTEEVFTPCIPASAANTSIAVVSAAPGTGGTVSVSAWGYQQ